jgi:hypothetical protein
MLANRADSTQDVIAMSETKGDHLVKLLSVDPDK